MTTPLNEAEEFEFLYQMEQEAQAGIPPPHPDPSTMDVVKNAAMKGVAGFADMFLNAPVNAYNVAKAGAVLTGDVAGFPQVRENLEITPQPNLIQRGMEAVGAIRAEDEPQTAGQRILDVATQGGVGMMGTPLKAVGAVPKAIEFGRNVLLGVTAGGAAGATKEATGSDLAATAVGMAVPLVTAGLGALGARASAPTRANPVKLSTLKEAQAAGLKMIPSQIKPSFAISKTEGIGGKAAIKQQIQAGNVEAVDELGRKAIGLPSGTPITREAILDVRENVAAVPYREVEALRASQTNLPWFPRYHSANLLEEMKQAKASANKTFQQYYADKQPTTLERAKQFLRDADSINDDIAMIAKAAGKPDLVKRLDAGRKLYARTYDLERAMNFADGHVDPHVLGAMFRKKVPLSGELAVIGKFAATHPDAVRPAARIQSAGVSGTEAGMGALLGMGGAATAGPWGLLAGGLPLLRAPARAALQSGMVQKRLLKAPPALDETFLKSLLAGRTISETER